MIKKEKKVLFICYIPHLYSISFRKFRDLIKRLNSNSQVVSFDLHSQRLLTEINYQFKKARSYIQKEDTAELKRQMYKDLDTLWDNFRTGTKSHLTHKSFIWDAFEKRFKYEATETVYILTLLNRIIDAEKPTDIYLIAEPGQLKRAISKTAQARGIRYKTLHLRKIFILLTLIQKLYFLGIKKISGLFIDKNLWLILTNVQKINKKAKAFFRNKPHSLRHNVGKGKILFMGNEDLNETKEDIPIIKELIGRKWNALFIVGPEHEKNMPKALISNNIPHLRFDAYLDYKSTAEITKDVKVCLKKIAQLKSKITKELFCYKHINILDIKKVLWLNYFSPLAIENILKYHKAVWRIFDIEQPAMIIVPHDQFPYGWVAAKLAKEKNIPLVSIIAMNVQLPQFIPRLDIMCDRMLVSGEATKDYFVEAGMDSSRICITGAAKWDDLLRKKIFLTREQLCRKLKLNPEKDIFLFTTQGFPQDAEIVNTIISLMRQYPGKQMIIKIHPQENGLDKYLTVLFSNADNITVTKHAPMWDLLINCKLLITTTSVTAFEAMIFNKPTIILDIDIFPCPVDYIKEQAAAIVSNKDELFSAVANIINDEQFKDETIRKGQRFVDRYISGLRGDAATRKADVIEDIINKYHNLNKKEEVLIEE